MTTKELINLIDERVKNCKSPNEIYNLEQPKEWIKIKKSVINDSQYEYNDIELIEALMDRMFSEWHYEIIFNPIIVQDKTGISVTVTIKLYYGTGIEESIKTGVATEYITSMKMLPLATPKAASMAFKNAARKIGKLFGNSLNRGLDEAILPEVQIEKETPDRAEQRYKILIDDCKTKEELKTYQFVVPANLKDYYNQKMKSL